MGSQGDDMYLKPLHLPKARILVLEEDRHLRDGLCAMLAESGYALAEDADGSGVGPGDDRGIDLVIASIGGSCLKSAAIRNHAAPVIVMVDRHAWTGFDFFDTANELGAVAALQRPFTRSALLRSIAQVLSGEATDAAASQQADEDRPGGLAELLRHLENPNFA